MPISSDYELSILQLGMARKQDAASIDVFSNFTWPFYHLSPGHIQQCLKALNLQNTLPMSTVALKVSRNYSKVANLKQLISMESKGWMKFTCNTSITFIPFPIQEAGSGVSNILVLKQLPQTSMADLLRSSDRTQWELTWLLSCMWWIII